jgi:hypothetical protein
MEDLGLLPDNPTLLSDNPALLGNNGGLLCVRKIFQKNLKKVAEIFAYMKNIS